MRASRPRYSDEIEPEDHERYVARLEASVRRVGQRMRLVEERDSVEARPRAARAARTWIRRNWWEIRSGEREVRLREKHEELAEVHRQAEERWLARKREEAAEILMLYEIVSRNSSDYVM